MPRPYFRQPANLLMAIAGALLAALMLLGLKPDSAYAAPTAQDDATISGPALAGALAPDGDRHYLHVEPIQRDGFIVLTLAFEPLNTDLQGLVNFLVLDEDQLRRFVAGDLDVREENIAGGAPLQFDPVGNKMRASFQDSGRGEYAVIVYNNAAEPVTYTLEAIGGRLVDELDQTTLPSPVESPAATPTSPAEDADTTTGSASIAVRAATVSGELAPPIARHYIDIDPTIRDGRIDLKMIYEPDSEALAGFVNFVVLDEDGVRRLIRGDDVFDLELAAGSPIPFSDRDNELGARFRASGDGPYTAVLYNGAADPANYTFEARGAALIDLYGQTSESQATPAGVGAQPVAPTPTPDPLPPGGDDGDFVLVSNEETADDNRAAVLTGLLDQPFEHHYYGLFPNVRDGKLTVTLDYDPRNSDALRGNVNFWVLDADGLRRVIAGARPEDVDIAAGAVVPFGFDKGKLRAIFNASARGEYTVIVYNNSETAAVYSLQIQGGELEDLSEQAAALGTLP
jgi:hypothetical protein